MARGLTSASGATRVAQNGYHYTKVRERGWVLTHWLTAEQLLGREIDPQKETVRFREGYTKRDYRDMHAIVVVPKNSTNLRKRKAILEDRRREIDAELERINKELGE